MLRVGESRDGRALLQYWGLISVAESLLQYWGLSSVAESLLQLGSEQ